MYRCLILADSVNPVGVRVTTVEAEYPRIVHSEFMTHRVFSRNAASSRAIPLKKMLSIVEKDPFVPLIWGKNQSGMVMGEEFSPEEQERFNRLWLRARNYNMAVVRRYEKWGVHKSLPNRLLEPWQYITVVITATEWDNFFSLRIADDAEPHICKIAQMIYEARAHSVPKQLRQGEWHLPYIGAIDIREVEERFSGYTPAYREFALAQISAARTARVSYLNQGGERDIAIDMAMCADKLQQPGHWSPLEHPCRAKSNREYSGNIRGFQQFRKMFPNENRRSYVPRLAENRAPGNAVART